MRSSNYKHSNQLRHVQADSKRNSRRNFRPAKKTKKATKLGSIVVTMFIVFYLRAAERVWKIVNIKKNDIEIRGCFYISCFAENSSNIILFAANENDNHNFESLEFEDGDEEGNLKQFNSNIKITDVCPDKMFHPINDNMSILIPLINYNVVMYLIKSDLKIEKKTFPDGLKQIYD